MRKMMGGFFCSLTAFAILTACGGGGSSPAPPVVPPAAKTSTATISGTAIISLSALVSKSAAKLDGAAIDIVSYDKSDKELGRAAVLTDAVGGFAAQVPLLDTGGYVIVIVTKEGFSQYQKRVDYTTPGNIELKAALQGLNVAFANVSSGTSSAITAGVGKSSEPSFSFAVLKFPNGVKKALSGTAIRAAKSQAGVTSELEINIPASSLPGIKKLKGELNTYEPATESGNFPGSYTGVVGGKEGKMVSLAFDFVKITNADTGENLGQVAKKLVKSGVSKAADTATTVTRYIYTSSCDNLFIEDYNKTAAGHQVPVWSLNPYTGKWIFLGEGTIVDSTGNVITAPTKTGCSGGTYNLKIMVANTEFSKNWWNLDHIVFSTPTEVCLSGRFSFSNGDPVKNLFLSVSGTNLDYGKGVTNDSGDFTLSTVLLNNSNSNKAGTLTYSDVTGTYVGTVVTLAVSPSCGTYNNILPKPCEVSGKLIDDSGKGVPYRWLNLSGFNFNRGTTSDSTGAYNSLVACNADISLNIGGTPLVIFNVNGTVTVATETTDDGTKAVLKDITLPNIPPSGYVYLSQRSIKNTGSITGDISVYDEDGNYPVNYVLKIISGATVSKTYSGAIDGTTTSLASQVITGLAVGEYTVELALTDSKGAQRNISSGNITVSDGSRPPVVTAYATQLSVNTCSGSNGITLYGSAFDPDGDSLSASWSGNGVNCAGNNGTNGFINSSCEVTVTGNTTYTYSVTDNSTPSPKSASRQIVVSTYSSAPWVSSLSSSPTLVVAGATGTARNVTVTAVANHSDNINLSGNWTLNGASLSSCPNVTAIPSGTGTVCSYTIPDTATIGDKFTFIYTATGCDKSGSRATTVTYGNQADVNIVVQ